MKLSRTKTYKADIRDSLLILGVAAAGSGLFFLLRFIELKIHFGPLFNAALEELGKLLLFIPLLFARGLKDEKRTSGEKELDLLLLPFFAVCIFAIIENIAYFLSFPSTFIFIRIVTSFLLHINTALVLLLIFAAFNWRYLFLTIPAAILYHWLLNSITGTGVSYDILTLMGIIIMQSVIFFILLFLAIRKIIPTRLLNDRKRN